MMHGYLAFDGNDELLCYHSAHGNTITEQASGTDRMFPITYPPSWIVIFICILERC